MATLTVDQSIWDPTGFLRTCSVARAWADQIRPLRVPRVCVGLASGLVAMGECPESGNRVGE